MITLCSPWLYSISEYFLASIIWCCAPYASVSNSVVRRGRHVSNRYGRRCWEGYDMPRRNLRCFISLWIVVLLFVGCRGETVSHDDPTSSTYQPTPPQPQEAGARLVGPVVYTVDAR